MAFEQDLMSKLSSSFTENKVSVMWAYGPSTDTIATITASGFFNDWADQVSKDDFLYIAATNGNDIRNFSNVTGVKPVTVAAFITAGDLADGSVTEPKIDPNSLTGTVVANVADANVIGGIPVLFRIDTAGGATANTDVIMTHTVRIIDVLVLNRATGTASDTIQILNTANVITNAIDISASNETVARVGTISDAFFEIPASGILRVTETDGGGSDSPPTSVYVTAVRVA